MYIAGAALDRAALGPNPAGKIRYIDLIQLIGFRTLDFPACSIVPQPLRYRVPRVKVCIHFYTSLYRRF
jgi:hypothetical protein